MDALIWKHLKVAKSIPGIMWGFPERKGANLPVVVSRYVNGKLTAKREVEWDFMWLPLKATTWNKLMREADKYEALGGREAYITANKIPNWWRKAA